MVPGYVEWCKNCDFFSRIYVFGMLGPRGPLGVGKNPSTICITTIILLIKSATVRLHVAYVGSGYYPLSWTPLKF